MRYYAGNWPYSIWLFKGDACRKLDKLKGSSGWLSDQLSYFYDDAIVEAVKSRIMAFRLMHLQGGSCHRFSRKSSLTLRTTPTWREKSLQE